MIYKLFTSNLDPYVEVKSICWLYIDLKYEFLIYLMDNLSWIYLPISDMYGISVQILSVLADYEICTASAHFIEILF